MPDNETNQETSQAPVQSVVHTPGPWKATGTKALGLSEVVAPNSDFTEGHLVCTINKGGYQDGSKFVKIPRQQREATAQLIAEAPAMRKALEDVRAALNRRARNELESEVFHIANRALLPLEEFETQKVV
jgi:hypothetical protein